MPLYYDARAVRVSRVMHPVHHQFACEFVEALRGANYFERKMHPDYNELSEEDLTDSVIAEWAHYRAYLANRIAHIYFHHKSGFGEHAHGGEASSHGHFPPTLLTATEEISWNRPMGNDEHERAKRDLLGLVGLKTAAARGKFDPRDVWSDS